MDTQPATKPEPVESNAIGIDLGIKHFATLSTGEKIDNSRFLNKFLKRLKRDQRKHSRRQKDGKNREKPRRKLALLHEKVVNRRKDFLHKLTTRLTRKNKAGTICIEN
ncbi:RNA-guided endonuclease TnpB family protein [Spirosoma pomorum]